MFGGPPPARSSGQVTRANDDDDPPQQQLATHNSSHSRRNRPIPASSNNHNHNHNDHHNGNGHNNVIHGHSSHIVESKEDYEHRHVAVIPAASSSIPVVNTHGAPRSSAALAALDADTSEDEDDGANGGANGGGHHGETAANGSGGGDGESSAPTAKEVYSRPLLYYKRASSRRDASSDHGEPGPSQLMLPDGTMCLGFPPLKASRRARDEQAQPGESVVIFTPRNDEQETKTRLWACILLFLIPADVILIFSIFFLGGPVVDEESYDAGTTDLITFLCALIALALGIIGMKLKDTRLITLFIVVFYIDSIINLIRISSILQLAQFFVQVGVAHAMSHYKSTLLPQWWVAET